MDWNIAAGILIALDQETHNHLRETDQKREHLLELYLMFVLAAFSGITGAGLLGLAWTPLTLVAGTLLLALLTLFGETCFFGQVSARKWHAEYMNVHLLIQTALVHGTLQVDTALLPPHKRQPFLPSYTSRSFLLVQLCSVSLLVAAGTIWYQHTGLPTPLAASCGVAAALFWANHVRAVGILRKAENAFWSNPGASWLIAGLPGTTATGELPGQGETP